MKHKKRWVALAIAILMVSMISMESEAKIDFDSLADTRIDLRQLSISKTEFFGFIADMIQSRPKGLGKYGRIPFQACDFKVEGKKLIDYNAPNGRGNEYLSNPSCDQLVIRRVLEVDYGYDSKKLGDYKDRQCVLSVEGIFSPIMEYYSIIYEEKSNPDCYLCEQKENNRLTKIIKLQRTIEKDCAPQNKEIGNFLKDLDKEIEAAFINKTK